MERVKGIMPGSRCAPEAFVREFEKNTIPRTPKNVALWLEAQSLQHKGKMRDYAAQQQRGVRKKKAARFKDTANGSVRLPFIKR